jgi:hypothetical protein
MAPRSAFSRRLNLHGHQAAPTDRPRSTPLRQPISGSILDLGQRCPFAATSGRAHQPAIRSLAMAQLVSSGAFPALRTCDIARCNSVHRRV